MKKLLFTISAVLVSATLFAQTKKDGTPDMRYKANKEIYGNSYNSSNSYNSGYSNSYNSYNHNTYSEPKKERNYNSGGEYKIQDGYIKSNGTYVEPHLKTTPDNNIWNNKNPK